MDERLRRLEQSAILGDPSAQLQLINGLKLSGDLHPDLSLIIDFIDPRYRWSYYSIVKFLSETGIPFEFRPDSRCGCENMACVEADDHIGSLESYCQKCHQLITEDMDETGIYLSTGVCLNPECPLFQAEPQHTVGPCSRIAWRTQDRWIGGLCDICSTRMPKKEHSEICNCLECGTGIGPRILLRSRITSPVQLSTLANSYERIFGDRRTVTQPFTENLNISPAEEQQRQEVARRHGYQSVTPLELGQEQRNARFLNSFGSCLIEILSDGDYRLRMIEHLNEQTLKISFFTEDMTFCQQIGLLPDPTTRSSRKRRGNYSPRIIQPYRPELHQVFLNACALLRMYYLGRDFSLEGIIRHLSSPDNRAPDARTLANQISSEMWDAFPHLLFNSDEIDNLNSADLHFVLLAQLTGYLANSIIPIAVDVIRNANFDEANFYIPNREMSVYPTLILNTSYDHPRALDPQRIIRAIVEEINRAH